MNKITPEYKVRVLKFFDDVKAMTSLDSRYQVELQSLHNYFFESAERIDGCDLCAIRFYKNLQKVLQKIRQDG